MENETINNYNVCFQYRGTQFRYVEIYVVPINQTVPECFVRSLYLILVLNAKLRILLVVASLIPSSSHSRLYSALTNNELEFTAA